MFDPCITHQFKPLQALVCKGFFMGRCDDQQGRRLPHAQLGGRGYSVDIAVFAFHA